MGTNIDAVGYLAVPDSGTGPGVLVLQEWWGLVPHIKDLADRFAAAGFVALAPDLYRGVQTQAPDEAERLFMALNIEQTAANLRTAAEFLLSHAAVTRPSLGVVGFCMGGQLALLAGTVIEQIGAVVDFYGVHPNVKPDFSKLKAPVLGLFAQHDGFVTPEVVDELIVQIRKAGGSIQAHTYSDTDHAFFNDTRPEVHNPEAAADAWERTLDFLNRHLVAV